MTNNASQVLHVIQRDLFGLGKTIDHTTGKFNMMKVAAVGAMGVIGGAAVLGGLGKMVAAGAEVVHQQQLMYTAGMSNKDVALATAAAWQTTSKVMGTSIVENLKSIRELRIAFSSAAAESGGNTSAAGAEAMKYLPLMARAQMILGANLGGDAQNQVYDYAKALEMIGATQNPKRFTVLLDGMIRAAEASGGKVTGAGYFSAMKYGRTAALGWNNDFITDVLPLLIQEYGGGGGSGSGGPGNALMSAFQAVVGGTMSNKSAEIFNRLHLLNRGSVIYTSTGNIKGVRPGGVAGSGEFSENPYQWVQDYLMPAFAKAHITDPKVMQELIAHMFGNRTASSMITAFATQQERFKGSADLTNQAQGLSAWDKLMNSPDLMTNWNAFTTGLGNLLDALGLPMVPLATRMLHDLTVRVDALTTWASQHQGEVRIIGIAAAGIATLVTGLATVAVIVAAGSALALAFSPAGWFVIGLMAIGTALGYLATHIKDLENEFSSLLPGGPAPGQPHAPVLKKRYPDGVPAGAPGYQDYATQHAAQHDATMLPRGAGTPIQLTGTINIDGKKVGSVLASGMAAPSTGTSGVNLRSTPSGGASLAVAGSN